MNLKKLIGDLLYRYVWSGIQESQRKGPFWTDKGVVGVAMYASICWGEIVPR